MSAFSLSKINIFKKSRPVIVEPASTPSKSTDVAPTVKKFKLEDFTVVRTVGTGSFGRVFLVKSKENPVGPPMAIKRLKKAEVIRQKQVEHILSEKKILQSVRHPFIVSSVGSFKDDRYLYLVMEFVVGGEFFTHLRKCRRFEDNVAKFYAAQISLMFDYLHSKNIIYRDLKPENVMMAKDGYLKLTDFGFAKIIEYRTYTLCGTPEYIAPEVLLNKGHGKPVDWWTIGIIIYEMIVGYPPFYDEEPMGIYQKILNGKVNYPTVFDKHAKALVKRLLTHDLTKRFGNLKGGAEDIKNHKWFTGLSWDDLYHKRINAPYRPTVRGDDDTSNFEEYPESQDRPNLVAPEDDPFTDW
eukprot:GHVP01052869.1.p1 GENE.GHVP01052869.1~~GHVP01052869.1.p1  ORF type:complete len:354 (+),score=42.45 GHVP01052869.1:168-1229(+)